jgi:hypothetical protein
VPVEGSRGAPVKCSCDMVSSPLGAVELDHGGALGSLSVTTRSKLQRSCVARSILSVPKDDLNARVQNEGANL